jgi:hypothetical protein
MKIKSNQFINKVMIYESRVKWDAFTQVQQVEIIDAEYIDFLGPSSALLESQLS